ncbi:hypothetical protein KGQ71_03215 [Patescibacteria group bacterium]|nr:hypothetical protein [Patescibacteria group bacterium]
MRLVQQDEAALHRTIGRKQYELDKSKLNLLFDVRKELDDQRARQIVGSLLS